MISIRTFRIEILQLILKEYFILLDNFEYFKCNSINKEISDGPNQACLYAILVGILFCCTMTIQFQMPVSFNLWLCEDKIKVCVCVYRLLFVDKLNWFKCCYDRFSYGIYFHSVTSMGAAYIWHMIVIY